jgi:cysteine-rich secretory family protein
MKAAVGVIAVLFLLTTSLAFADPQSEISAYRKSHGLSPVTIDPKLTALASRQAKAMATRGVMDHSVYAPFSTRIASYGTTSAGENIAMGTKTFEETLAIWKGSWGHNANLLLGSADRMGIASASGNGKTYWALVLAAGPSKKPKLREAAFTWGSDALPSLTSIISSVSSIFH